MPENLVLGIRIDNAESMLQGKQNKKDNNQGVGSFGGGGMNPTITEALDRDQV